jgi:hypothetical protein
VVLDSERERRPTGGQNAFAFEARYVVAAVSCDRLEVGQCPFCDDVENGSPNGDDEVLLSRR